MSKVTHSFRFCEDYDCKICNEIFDCKICTFNHGIDDYCEETEDGADCPHNTFCALHKEEIEN